MALSTRVHCTTAIRRFLILSAQVHTQLERWHSRKISTVPIASRVRSFALIGPIYLHLDHFKQELTRPCCHPLATRQLRWSTSASPQARLFSKALRPPKSKTLA